MPWVSTSRHEIEDKFESRCAIGNVRHEVGIGSLLFGIVTLAFTHLSGSIARVDRAGGCGDFSHKISRCDCQRKCVEVPGLPCFAARIYEHDAYGRPTRDYRTRQFARRQTAKCNCPKLPSGVTARTATCRCAINKEPCSAVKTVARANSLAATLAASHVLARAQRRFSDAVLQRG